MSQDQYNIILLLCLKKLQKNFWQGP